MNFVLNFNFLLLGLFFVSLISVHCQTPTKTYSSHRPSLLCSPSDYMRYPTNVDEVVAIVNEAIKSGVKVKAIGARHSETDIICTEGIPVDMNKLKSRQMNSDNVTATFGPGVTIHEAGVFLLENGRALRTTPAYGNITLGGAIGTGAHGSTIKYTATISAQVKQLTVIDGLGRKLVITDPDDLNAYRINLGLLGIVVEITLSTVPLYKVTAHNYVVADDVLTNGVAENWAKTADQMVLYWFPTFKQVVVANLTFEPVYTQVNAISYGFVPPTYGYFNMISTKSKEIAFELTSTGCPAASALGNTIGHVVEFYSQSTTFRQTLGFVPIYTEDGIHMKNPAVGYPHLMFSPVCSEENVGLAGLSCAWSHGDIKSNITILDNEIGIGLTNLSAFITAAKDIVSKTPTLFPMQGVLLRFTGKSDILMSTAYHRDTVNVEFYLFKRTDAYNKTSGNIAGYQAIMQTMTKRFGGRSHWGKSGSVFHNRQMLDMKFDPAARNQFIAAMDKFDPNGVFLNNFGRRIRNISSTIDTDPKITRCALLDNCFCSKNSDCADTQICGYLNGYSSYPVCKIKNEVSEPPFDINSIPLLDDILNWLNVTVPGLADAALNTCSLLGLVPDIVGPILG